MCDHDESSLKDHLRYIEFGLSYGNISFSVETFKVKKLFYDTNSNVICNV